MMEALIIGGGAVGLASAWQLAQRGATVTLIERDPSGEESASVAAAGMLSAQLEHHESEAMAELCLRGRERHATFLEDLTRTTGDDLDHRRVGATRVAHDEDGADALAALVEVQRRRGWEARLMTAAEARRIEPLLGDVRVGAHFPGERVVDPPRLVKALRRACGDAGVRFRLGQTVRSIADNGRGVLLSTGEAIEADRVVLAGGAWSSEVAPPGRTASVRPIRGQMLELRTAHLPRGLLEGPGCYLSPRSDGRLLVGSTLEDVGFERAVTEEARSRLLEAAGRLVPALVGVEPSRHWCGFRAATPDGLPLLGETASGLIVATGHHRNGVLLSAISADIVTSLVFGEPPPLALAPFRPDRSMLPAPA